MIRSQTTHLVGSDCLSWLSTVHSRQFVNVASMAANVAAISVSPAQSGVRMPASPRPEALVSVRLRRLLGLAGCVFVMALLVVGCGGSGSSAKDVDGGDTRDASGSDGRPGNVDGGGTPDATDLDGSPGRTDGGGDTQDANGSDGRPGNVDGGGTPDSGVPDGIGVENCVTACETFLMTNCSTPAAEFCESAQQNCETRYEIHGNCQAELEAMDVCAAAQPLRNFSCPLGTIPDEARPYHLTEDVCLRVANELINCLGN